MVEEPPAEAPAVVEEAPIQQVPAIDDTNVIYLSSRVRRWRNVASFASALAAALVAMLALQVYQPDLLPAGIRPKPRTQMVEVKTPAPAPARSAQFVARAAAGRRLAGLHPHRRCRDQEFHGAQGRRDAGARQELRALADLRQAAAAALARRDRRQRFHRAPGAVVLRCRHRQWRDLCGDGRAGRAARPTASRPRRRSLPAS